MKKQLQFPNIIFNGISTWIVINIINMVRYTDTNLLSFGQETSFARIIIAFIAAFILLNIIDITIDKPNYNYYQTITLCLIAGFLWSTRNNNIFFAVIIFLCFLLLYKYKPKNLDFSTYINKRNIKIPIIIFTIIMFLIISTIGVLRYLTFSAPNFDLGIPTQNFYYLKKLLVPLSTCERDILLSHFNIHVSLVYYLALPLYCLYSSAATLQVTSALLIASGVIPIYLITQNHKLSKYLTLIICIIYTIYAPAICSTFYDFHENMFLIPLLLWLFYAYEKNENILFAIMTFFVLTTKEDAPIYMIIFSIYMIIDNHKKKGLITLIISLIYFYLVLTYLKTYGEGVMSDRYNNLIFNNTGILGAIKTIMINPEYFFHQLVDGKTIIKKITYILQLLLPLGFIPCISKKWKNYILLLPLLVTTMTTYEFSYDINFHYTCGIIAFLFYVFILNIADWKNNSYITICLISSIMMYANYAHPTLINYINEYENNKNEFAEMDAFLKQIPEDASVSSTSFQLSHLANRDIIYETYYHKDVPDIDYLVIDITSNENYQTYLKYISNGYYEFSNYNNKLIILKRLT